MTGAVFAGEKIEEFSLVDIRSCLALFLEPLANFAKHFFGRNRPTDARDGYGKSGELFSGATHDELMRAVVMSVQRCVLKMAGIENCNAGPFLCAAGAIA